MVVTDDTAGLPAPTVLATFGRGAEAPLSYKAPVPPGGAVAFTSDELTEDLEWFGPGSLDLWLSSTASDTDLQVTVSQIRPDGNEQCVQRGWLRASHRAIDEDRSRPTMPQHTYSAATVSELTPDRVTPMRIAVWPFNHVFRAGSRLRVTVESPVGATGFRQLQVVPNPAVNTIHVGPDTPSRLVFGRVPGGVAPTEMPSCDTLINQPCRTATLP